MIVVKILIVTLVVHLFLLFIKIFVDQITSLDKIFKKHLVLGIITVVIGFGLLGGITLAYGYFMVFIMNIISWGLSEFEKEHRPLVFALISLINGAVFVFLFVKASRSSNSTIRFLYALPQKN